MESPYNRPIAANLIKKIIEDYHNKPVGWAGFSLEMSIYTVLRNNGYLTLEAMEVEE